MYVDQPDLAPVIAARLREARTRAGYSVPELAAFSGVSARTISRIEQAQTHVRVRTLKWLSLALGLTLDWWCEER